MFVALVFLGAFAAPQATIASPSTAPSLIAPSPIIVPPSEPPIILKKGTIIGIRTGAALSSSLSKPGQMFPLNLAEGVTEDGRAMLPKGLTGQGEVVHAAKSRWGGKAGELIVNARFLTCGATRVPLGKMKAGGAGDSRVGTAFAASMLLTPLMFAVSGGNIEIPSGTNFTATVTADTALPAGGCPIAIEAPASSVAPVEPVQQSNQGGTK